MKIGIITLPLHYNYGGCLQAYALQRTLEVMGHEAFILCISDRSIKARIKRGVDYFTKIGKFKRNNVNNLVLKEFSVDECKRHNLDALIVGSDQVWRRVYTNNNFFLGFLGNDTSIIRLAYAASFSVDYLEFNKQEISLYSTLLSKFKAISVREDTALNLLNTYFGCHKACHVLDPTMLIDANEYRKKIKGVSKKEYVYVYLLGKKGFINSIIKHISQYSNCSIRTTIISKNRVANILNARFGIEDWLANICDAKLMVTDSFHGCVFSIIFNTDFVVVENKAGGNTRIESLLRLFNMEDRIIHSLEDCKRLSSIDWKNVNMRMKEMREFSVNFLNKNLIEL